MQTDRHTNQRTYKLTDIQISSVSVQFQTPTEQHLSKMGPKKDKSKEKLQTKTIKCPYYDRGYCKYGEECFKIHPDKVCEKPNCFSDKCDKRHPNPCKFGQSCTYNKNNICLYSHVTTASDDENKLNKKFTVIENQATGMINKFEKIIDEKYSRDCGWPRRP